MSIKKKAKGKGQAAARKSEVKKPAVRTRTPKKKKGKDIVQVREGINELVKASAKKIASKVIAVAETGQLASARYLFEAVGLYPATEQTAAPVPLKDTLAGTLLARMGIPTEPVSYEDEPEGVPALEVNGTKAETTMPSTDEAGREDTNEAVPPDGEQ